MLPDSAPASPVAAAAPRLRQLTAALHGSALDDEEAVAALEETALSVVRLLQARRLQKESGKLPTGGGHPSSPSKSEVAGFVGGLPSPSGSTPSARRGQTPVRRRRSPTRASSAPSRSGSPTRHEASHSVSRGTLLRYPLREAVPELPDAKAFAFGSTGPTPSSPSTPLRSSLPICMTSEPFVEPYRPWGPILTQLLGACVDGDLKRVKSLLSRHDWTALLNAAVDEKTGRTALHLAARHGHVEVCSALVRSLAPVDAVEHRLVTPISLAAMYGHAGVVDILLQTAARPEQADAAGRTALHFGSCCEDANVVRLLLEAQPGLASATDRGGRSAVHYALTNRHGFCALEILQVLLQRRCEPDRADSQGRSPLVYATENGNAKAVKMLLHYSHGQDGKAAASTSGPASPAAGAVPAAAAATATASGPAAAAAEDTTATKAPADPSSPSAGIGQGALETTLAAPPASEQPPAQKAPSKSKPAIDPSAGCPSTAEAKTPGEPLSTPSPQGSPAALRPLSASLSQDAEMPAPAAPSPAKAEASDEADAPKQELKRENALKEALRARFEEGYKSGALQKAIKEAPGAAQKAASGAAVAAPATETAGPPPQSNASAAALVGARPPVAAQVGEPRQDSALKAALRARFEDAFKSGALAKAVDEVAVKRSPRGEPPQTAAEGAASADSTAAESADKPARLKARLHRAVHAIADDCHENAEIHGSTRTKFAATVAQVELKELLRKHPYLERAGADVPHPLHYWVGRCETCIDHGHLNEAQTCLRRVVTGLQADARQIAVAFRRFDLDGSNKLELVEFKHMCAYLGWDDAVAQSMDVDKDGVVTLEELQLFVQRRGGVQKLFEERRRRVALSRRDVVSSISVGSRVKAHFYVNGQKSKTWREATVLEVGVQAKQKIVGPSQQLAKLEYGFDSEDSGNQWKATQRIPLDWIISDTGDADSAAALREVGILDEECGYWSLIFPLSEMRAVERLVSCQRSAVAAVRREATKNHDEMLPVVRKRFDDLGYGEQDLQAVLTWVQDLAPVIIHISIDTVGPFLEMDEFYRNQFETQSSKGYIDPGNQTRVEWERDLFGGHYDDAKPFERCKYGVLNVMNDYMGVRSATQYGDSYLVLKDVRLRLTFAAEDSGGIAGSKLGVLDKYAHVLNDYEDHEIHSLVTVATAPEPRPLHERARLLRGHSEAVSMAWVTMGFPQLTQGEGRFYYEVELFKGVSCAQVGLLSKDFEITPYAESSEGVGDDMHGWAVDGHHAALFHGGTTWGWSQRWKTNDIGELGENVCIGVAVDIEQRRVYFTCDGTWSDQPTFSEEVLPIGVELYPALSFQGRAAFNFDPPFKFAPPVASADEAYMRWAGAPSGRVRVDCPRIGNSDNYGDYKEIQIHGEVSLKRNVQRLVACDRYRTMPKTLRSWAVCVSNTGVCDGMYRRVGACGTMPTYKSESGFVIEWHMASKRWRLGKADEPEDWVLVAEAKEADGNEPPRAGWQAPPAMRGRLPVDVIVGALTSAGFSGAHLGDLLSRLSSTDSSGQTYIYRHKDDDTLEEFWCSLPSPPWPVDVAWSRLVEEQHRRLLAEAGFAGGAVVESKHPYDGKMHSWKECVHVKDAGGLRIHFSSQSRTYDEEAYLSILVGGLRSDAAGPGARVQLRAFGEALKGTVVEAADTTKEDAIDHGTLRIAGAWRVHLDFEDRPCFKELATAAATEIPTAVCRERPTTLRVAYATAGSVGLELAGFDVNRSEPLTPLRVMGFRDAGPAHRAGVRPGWFLDIEATFYAAGSSACLDAIKAVASQSPDTLPAALLDVDTFQRLLEIALGIRGDPTQTAAHGVTLVFVDSLQAHLLPEIHAHYPDGQTVGAEIATLEETDHGLRLETLCSSDEKPAQRAGARATCWQVNVEQTRERSPSLAELELEEVHRRLQDPEQRDTMTDVTLVLQLEEAEPWSCVPEGRSLHGDSENWLEPIEVPKHNVADFCFQTDGDGYPEGRWGFFAIVLPLEKPPPTQADVDAFAERWMQASGRARGVDTSAVSVEKDSWYEGRLRALCARHGWEFQWMSEDGERRRLMNERQRALVGFGDSTGEKCQPALTSRMASAMTLPATDATGDMPDGKIEI
eukprot:TRINITY_DN36274_c0_g1_i1.p1 TRINITY_DN36274_c0_g1~~TRINITY_DN36274_c0_g1_i1.p1  ORF type:complete len:2107 (+),score=430.46 TRINITY_DN36274_c0_g1_i1:138-6458(+)